MKLIQIRGNNASGKTTTVRQFIQRNNFEIKEISIKGKKTIIAIAHRLSTLISCDRIAYMKDGTIVDVGTFQELCIKYDDFNEIVRLSRIKLEEENE